MYLPLGLKYIFQLPVKLIEVTGCKTDTIAAEPWQQCSRSPHPLVSKCIGGTEISIAAFQADDPYSIPVNYGQ